MCSEHSDCLQSMMVDEADIDLVGGGGGGGGGGGSSQRGSKRSASTRSQIVADSNRGPPNKRKPGPIPKDMVVRRPQSPCPGVSLSPPCSPYPSPPSSPAPVFETSVPTLAYSGDIPSADAQQPSLPNGPAGKCCGRQMFVEFEETCSPLSELR